MDVVSSIGNESCVTINTLKKLVISQRQPEFPEVDATFAKAVDFLDQCHVRISVVGQVKAGKSTLINVLSGAKGLLPTEVNPWTAVITNLHFGHVDKPHVGGVFQLFSEDEWQRMLEGDKETRSLAENLLPGFDSAILKEQVEEMQEKARKRLGSLYKHLLGKSHKFNSITPEILERYVSAGHHDQGEDIDEAANAGRFSGITKSAEVFLERGPFSIPVTMSDTPGINDPFLVRDEITTTSFRDTDIFIVAVSIHQALGAADMALLKMLSRHSGKATVIFVNRIDEVDDPATDVPEILANLEKRLEGELAGANYLLIAGSAHWGHIAQHGNDEEVSAVSQSKEFKAYCDMAGVDAALSPRERLFSASGVSTLGQALSDRIADGPIKSALGKTATEVTAAVGMLEKLLRERLKNEEVALLDVGDVPAIIEAEKDRLITRINSLADLADELDENEDRTRLKLMENGEVVANSIRLTIEATLARFIDSQSSELGSALSSGSANAKWSLDSAELGQRIEEQTVESYHKGRSEVDELIAKFATATDSKISEVLAGIDIKNLLENLPHDDIFPGFKPSTTLVDIELVNERGWKFWKKAEMTRDEAISRVQKIIRQEMLPGVNICCEAASLAIAERTGEALSRVSKVKFAARNLIVDEVNTLKDEIETLDQGVNKKTITRINANRATRAKARRKQVDQLAKAKAKLIKNFGTEQVETSEPQGVSGRKARNE
jgi:hypothetical protein